jgi:hypothetical protein
MFRIFKIHGRTPPCENCKNRPSAMGLDGDSDLTKWKLCLTCFRALVDCVTTFARVPKSIGELK